jgi:hypothetical protein
MTETSGFWTTSGTPSGHQVASYTQVIAAKAWAILAAAAGFEGVSPGYLNGLAGSVPGANTARIATGGAVCDGQWYQNDANKDITIPSAVGGGNTRIDRIVVRATWAGFKCELTRIAGVDAASPTAPAITQTPGTTYDIMLYQALVNTSGTVTLTDERVIGSPFTGRQGGSATDWSIAGTTNYIMPPVRIQAGVVNVVSGSATVTFPVAFSQPPNVIPAPKTTNARMASVSGVSASGFTINLYADDGSAASDNVNWLAIGPK